MVNLIVPPPHIQMFAICKDDTLPKFKPDNWIENGRWYPVRCFAHALNTDGIAVAITDNKNKVIHPSDSMSSFKLERFDLVEIHLN